MRVLGILCLYEHPDLRDYKSWNYHVLFLHTYDYVKVY